MKKFIFILLFVFGFIINGYCSKTIDVKETHFGKMELSTNDTELFYDRMFHFKYKNVAPSEQTLIEKFGEDCVFSCVDANGKHNAVVKKCWKFEMVMVFYGDVCTLFIEVPIVDHSYLNDEDKIDLISCHMVSLSVDFQEAFDLEFTFETNYTVD